MATILVIDDERAQRMVATTVLAKAGHKVVEAEDGATGLTMIRQLQPDLVISDVLMPGLNGFRLVSAVRSETTICEVGIILLTALADKTYLRAGMNAGADDYLFKPYTAVELKAAVDSVLARRTQRRLAARIASREQVNAALEKQASDFERRLLREMERSWTRAVSDSGAYQATGCLVLAEPFHFARAVDGESARAALMQRLLDACRDAAYLFGADWVLPHGLGVVAFFSDAGGDDKPASSGQRALTAAFALRSGVLSALSAIAHPTTAVPVAVHCGAVTCLRSADPLHGDLAAVVVPGTTLQLAQGLLASATQRRWAVGATAGVLADDISGLARSGAPVVVTDDLGTDHPAWEVIKSDDPQ